MSKYNKTTNLLQNYTTISKSDFDSLLSTLSDVYYNSDSPLVSDEKFDSLVSFYNKKFETYKKVGASSKYKKEKLPIYMASLNKIKTEEESKRWTKKFKGPYQVTDKIDGVSALYTGDKLLTRGDGEYGSDISHILQHIYLPKINRKNINIYVRGELYMPVNIFKDKYSEKMSNPRNMVTGLINPLSNHDTDKLEDIKFMAYECFFVDKDIQDSQREQLLYLKKLGFEIPENKIINNISVDELKLYVVSRKKLSNYEMDGIVLVDDKPYNKPDDKNPENTVAFKIEGECTETEVEFVEWNISNNGFLKPRIKIKPVSLCGVTINWATGFNAKFIKDNKIGKGTILLITRSNDVIPYVKEVIRSTEEEMPDIEYIWNETEVDILPLNITGKYKEDYDISNITYFFKHLDAKFVGESTVRKLYNSGFKTLKSILGVEISDLLKIEGIKQKSAERIKTAISECINNIPIYKIASASRTLKIGFGEKNMKLIFETYPEIMNILDKNGNIDNNRVYDIVMKIKGFNEKKSSSFSKHLDNFRVFLQDHPMIKLKDTKTKKEKKINKEEDDDCIEISFEDSDEEIKCNTPQNKIRGKTVVFSGFRDKELEENIENNGGKVTTSVSKNTDILVVAQKYSSSSKELKAEQLGKEILNIDEFMEKYFKYK